MEVGTSDVVDAGLRWGGRTSEDDGQPDQSLRSRGQGETSESLGRLEECTITVLTVGEELLCAIIG